MAKKLITKLSHDRRSRIILLRNRLAQLDQTGRRPVVREAFVQGVASRIDDIARRIEIGLSYFKMNNVTAFCLERFCFDQHFECGLGAETRHTSCQPKLKCLGHAM